MTAKVTKRDLARITVYSVVGDECVECSLGETHDVKLVVRKFLGPVVAHEPYNNGYTTENAPIRCDKQGRRYQAHYPIDFHGSTTWVREGGHFSTRPPTGPHRFLSPADVKVRTTLDLVVARPTS